LRRSSNETLERRVHPRVPQELPVLIEQPVEQRVVGMIIDMSAWGALVLCSCAFAVGEEVCLVLAAAQGPALGRLNGEIVRVLALATARRWSHAFAVEFDEPLDAPWNPLLI
jgi:hypothetical protein